MTSSPIPTPILRNPLPRKVRWSCVAAAAAALAACGGSDDAPLMPRSINNVSHAAQMPTDICESQINDTAEKLLACVTLAAVRSHQAKFAEIAKANRGTRLAGTQGYNDSADYARQVLEEAGYQVTLQPFTFPVFQTVASSLLEAGSPAAAHIAHQVLAYSGSGDVTAAVGAPAGPTGCEAADFSGFTQGHIALLRRGQCALTDKVLQAIAAGAPGVVIYNNDDESELTGSLSTEIAQDFPVVMVSRADGERLAQSTGLQLRLKAETARTSRTTYNVLAESAEGDASHVTMVGAHLDSVRAGPGINDNGSGVSVILETARQMAHVKPANKLRFALWGAEEQGLLGSRHYVKHLSDEDKKNIGIYLNFDMIGSPNHVFFVFGEDGAAGTKTSKKIVNFFGDFYAQRSLSYKEAPPGGRSDHKSFADVNIPVGGVFTGAEGIKTRKEAETWGGRAGVAYDPCYHRSCDGLSNYGKVALETNASAVAHATLFFAMNKLAREEKPAD